MLSRGYFCRLPIPVAVSANDRQLAASLRWRHILVGSLLNDASGLVAFTSPSPCLTGSFSPVDAESS